VRGVGSERVRPCKRLQLPGGSDVDGTRHSEVVFDQQLDRRRLGQIRVAGSLERIAQLGHRDPTPAPEVDGTETPPTSRLRRLYEPA
jgi:hypothetical protein